MSPRRFFAPQAAARTEIWLSAAESHHLRRVLRLRLQAPVEVFDGRGHAFAARFVDTNGDGNCCLLRGSPLPPREPAIQLLMGVAVLKGDGFTAVARGLAEIGVASLTPLTTRRSVGAATPARLRRWRAAVLSGTRQSGRAVVPEVAGPAPFAAWIASGLPRARWIASPAPPESAAAGTGPRSAAQESRRALAVGPEGGFTEEELGAARSCGFHRLDLGGRVLRAGTAALVAGWSLLRPDPGSAAPIAGGAA